ncbi:hypothetical protein FIU88_08205 [Halomonas sp. THAF12]|uniref:hypothetical protein n=1 Tax=Halomonas sp. THAF12 TaxID=2587849 RepID=UPI001268C816|nr:hypothetical protein [Halomonas sp. THAF12]QFT84956.1 hypothetical protein FIU88_08205 [Halomonas sp. THAF12]
MALRIRSDGRILCAAIHPERPGDIYLNDGDHYHLSVELKALVTEPCEEHMERGEWWWKNQVPEGVVIDGFYLA